MEHWRRSGSCNHHLERVYSREHVFVFVSCAPGVWCQPSRVFCEAAIILGLPSIEKLRTFSPTCSHLSLFHLFVTQETAETLRTPLQSYHFKPAPSEKLVTPVIHSDQFGEPPCFTLRQLHQETGPYLLLSHPWIPKPCPSLPSV